MPERLDAALDRLRLRRAPSRPRQVHLSVTGRCFLPCLHCDIWRQRPEDLPTEDWLEAIDRLAAWLAPAGMNLAGGEPLLRRDLERLVERASRRGFEVSLNTNGWLVTPARARRLAGAGLRTAYVSLDGARAETVDRTRGREGSFEAALAAIDRFAEAGVPEVVVATVLHGGNAVEVPALLELAGERGLRLVVQPLYENFGAEAHDPDWWRRSPLWPRDEAALAGLEAALDALARAARRGAVLNPPAQLEAMKEHFRRPGADLGLSCRAGHSDVSVDPRGRLRLCFFLEPVGHVLDVLPPALAWEGPRAMRRRWEVSRCPRHCALLNCNFEETWS